MDVVAQLPRWAVALGLAAIGALGTRCWRRCFDYLDFVSACQFNMDKGTISCVHSCIVLEHSSASGEKAPHSFREVVRRFRAAYLGDTDEPVKPQFKHLLAVAKASAVWWPYWIIPASVPQLDEGYHFVQHADASSWEEVESWIGSSLSIGLDPERPLWQLHFWPRVGKYNQSVFLLKVFACNSVARFCF